MIGRPVKCGGCEWVGPFELFGGHIRAEHAAAMRPGSVFYYEHASDQWARQERGMFARCRGALARAAQAVGL
jgi:hypothetical protein